MQMLGNTLDYIEKDRDTESETERDSESKGVNCVPQSYNSNWYSFTFLWQ